MVPRRRAILVWAILGTFPAAGAAQVESRAVGEVRGRILDALSAEPLGQVNVTLRGTALRGYTDRGGRFVLSRIPSGTYTLDARIPGYEPLTRDSVRVTAGPPVEIDLVMQPLPIRLRDIVVSPGSFAFIEAGPASRQVLSREDIESVPQFGEDIFRAVNRVPGLSSGDYTAGFSIRGGRRDETLILLDGLEIYEPYHLKDFNEGAISIVDVETVEAAELMTGGFPARYGNRTAGVFSITSTDPRGRPARASLGLSFINARAMAQGTFAGERGSWLVSARRGYFDLILSLLSITDVPAPSYHDAFGKVRFDLSPNHSLAFNVLHARDRYTLDGLATTGFNDSIPTREIAGNRYGNSYAWLTLRSALGRRLTVTSMVSGGLVTASRDGSEFHRAIPDTMYAISNRRDFDVFGLKQDWQYEVSDRLILEAGGDVRRFTADYRITNRVWQDPDDPVPDTTTFFPQQTRTSRRRAGTTFAGYISGRLRPVEPLTIELGLRHDRAGYAGDSDWSPRIGALLRFGSRQLRFGWGHYRQSQAVADLAALDGLGRYFPSELSRQWTAGFEQRLAGGGELRVEAYDRRGSDLRPVYRNWKGVIDVFPETDDDRMLVFPVATRSRGIEVSHARELSRRFSLRGSYALSSVEEEVASVRPVNDSARLVFKRTHPAPQDQRHAVHLDLTWRPASNWSIYTSFAFHTGWPVTLERQVPFTGPGGAPDFTIRPGGLYAGRLPNYYRIDARVTKRAGNLRFYLEVLNLSNHENVSGYDYFRAPGPAGQVVLQQDPESWFTILPSLGISWSRSF